MGVCLMLHAHMHTYTHRHVKHDKHGCLHGGAHLQFVGFSVMCMCVHTCMCVHVGGTPQISKNAINLEKIQIIQFCLKICDLSGAGGGCPITNSNS